MTPDDRPDIAPRPETIAERMDRIRGAIAANEARRDLTDEGLREFIEGAS